jgi:hypothetical protein
VQSVQLQWGWAVLVIGIAFLIVVAAMKIPLMIGHTKINSPIFELGLMLVRFDHVASFIVNANHFVIAAWRAKRAESAA